MTSPAGNRTIGACNPSPGGVASNLQAWFDANNGALGTPVTTWNNLGPNANITQLTSANGGNMVTNDIKANYNNIVNTTGGFNGTFHAEVSDRTQLISGNEVTMYAAYQRANAPDLVFEFHGSVSTNPASNGANQWLAWGFRHGGMGTTFSNGTGHLYDNTTMAQMSQNSNLAGMFGTGNAAGGNSMNGSEMNYANIGAFHGGGNFMELSIGYWPGYGMSRGVMEAILWDSDLSAADRNRVESYLAIKYGITKGMNGTSIDYVSPTTGNVIWTIAANAGFNFDIAGISRSDVSGLDQRKSHSTNGSAIGTYNDIVTIANGTNFSSPVQIGADDSHLMWGHNNAPLLNTGTVVNYPTDNAETIQTILQREWKSEENGTIGTVTLEFDLSSVVGVNGVFGANALADVRLLVDEDGDFSNGATSIVPSFFDNTSNIVRFEHDFIPGTGNDMDQFRGFFFTIGSTDINTAPLPIELTAYEVDIESCSSILTWRTVSEQNNDYFVIERSYDMQSWEQIGTVDGAGNSQASLDYIYRDYSNTQNGSVYYRLSQVDFNGDVNHVGIQAIQFFCEDFVAPVAFPNPMNNKLMVQSTDEGTMMIFDNNGRITHQQDLIQGDNMIHVDHLATGSYIVRYVMGSGRTFTDQLIKL